MATAKEPDSPPAGNTEGVNTLAILSEAQAGGDGVKGAIAIG
jgi:hypothetical protein